MRTSTAKPLKPRGPNPVSCIPSTKDRKFAIPNDEVRNRKRRKIENNFARLKHWRRVATRYDRCHKVFLSACVYAAVLMFRRSFLTHRYTTFGGDGNSSCNSSSAIALVIATSVDRKTGLINKSAFLRSSASEMFARSSKASRTAESCFAPRI